MSIPAYLPVVRLLYTAVQHATDNSVTITADHDHLTGTICFIVRGEDPYTAADTLVQRLFVNGATVVRWKNRVYVAAS